VCGLVVLFASQTSTSRALVLPIGIAACLFAAVSGQLVPRVLSVGWVYIIGGMCYSIYLYHYAVISLVGPTMTRIRLGNGYGGNMAVQTLLLGSAVMVISAVFFVLVERPCMDPNWPAHMMAGLREPRRLLARLRPGAKSAPAASARDEQSSIVS
jgi:peptidoglycan/LPS O-acetylase OafA/YrhL